MVPAHRNVTQSRRESAQVTDVCKCNPRTEAGPASGRALRHYGGLRGQEPRRRMKRWTGR